MAQAIGTGGSSRGHVALLALSALIALGTLGGCCNGPRRSGIGESCTKTADCVLAGRCQDKVCVDEFAPAPAPAPAAPGPRGFSSLDNLGRAVVEAVRSGDPEKLRALLVTDAELEGVGKEAEVPPEKLKKLVTNVSAARKGFDHRWQKLQDGAERAGVVLSRIRFAGVAPYRVERRDGIEWLENNLDVLISFDGTDSYRLDVEDCAKTQHGWLLADPEVELELRKPSEIPSSSAPSAPSAKPK